LVEFFEQEIAGGIAGEWPTAGIGAVQPWRQPDNNQPRVGRTEGCNRGAVISGILNL
jgi:hypothetical protein